MATFAMMSHPGCLTGIALRHSKSNRASLSLFLTETVAQNMPIKEQELPGHLAPKPLLVGYVKIKVWLTPYKEKTIILIKNRWAGLQLFTLTIRASEESIASGTSLCIWKKSDVQVCSVYL